MKQIYLGTIFFLSLNLVQAQVKSPEEFLGYKIGSRYTQHSKIVNYFQHVAANDGTMVKLQQYGETNEGRPLLLAYISTADNIQNLENIRMNNLRLANSAADKVVAQENAPAIVWLSYNVHGNETSSSEASMLTLFALADPKNQQTKNWLKNTVVIIDPCVNPDGRDRYVNWFTSVAGKNYNARPDAREHDEPWPGGRTNHYNFDLNRDWAWQTQVESQQRMKVYNQWLPQVHVDFHEQGINQPYYFAPAAQPYHEVISPWQRDFQVTIGKNHAKYFDEKGWLYFTREIFDLYYPSYGDTYPTYNGAIGMTYEQGGGGGAGLAVVTDEGDTLTLGDRALHHYTTSLSTIEITSLNAPRVIKEFHNFFNEAVSTGMGEYKTYVIKSDSSSTGRINALLKLLDKNNIQYGTGSGTSRGYNYNTTKEETFSIGANDILISSVQPRSAMVKVLFEPQSKLVDSVTYDITAWALPYVYGLNAFASKTKINIAPFNKPAFIENPATDAYGYVIKWQGVESVKAISKLMQKGIKLRYSEFPFEASGQKFERGSIIIIKKNNEKFGSGLGSVVSAICNEANVKMYPVSSGFVDKGYDFGSTRVHPIKAPQVAMVTGEEIYQGNAGEVWHFFEQVIEYPVTLINSSEINRANWKDIDVLIMPGGTYSFLNDKADADQFKDWISRGGRVIALEEAVGQLNKLDSSLKIRKVEEVNEKDVKDSALYEELKIFEERERSFIPNITAGSIYKVALDNTHPLGFGYPAWYYTLKTDDTIYEFMKSGWNVGVIKKDQVVAGFVGSKLKNRLRDALIFGVRNVGRGTVTYINDPVLFRSFWENGKLLFCNAVFLVGQ